MTGVSISFPAGRFHATPWGRHVNEGVPEWPPSPWRFLRALVAAWKRKLDDQLSQADVEALLRALIAPPQFVLPSVSTGQTRHYMPWFKGWRPEEPEKAKTLVFDTFVSLPREARVVMLWPDATLPPRQRNQLELLLSHLNSFGRAESWCIARLLGDRETVEALREDRRCCAANDALLPPEMEIVRVLCADPDTALGNERRPKNEHTSGRAKAKTTVVTPLYDPDWHLCMETLELHEKNWSDPPGSQWIRYARRRDCFKIDPVRRVSRPTAERQMQVARFSLDSSVLPLVTETLRVAECARRMLMGIYGRHFSQREGSNARSAILAGKDEFSHPLSGHGHAYYLPTDEDGDGHLDHLTVTAADGFGPRELRALDLLREIKSRDEMQTRHPLRVLFLGLGRFDEYNCWPLRPSRLWVSATPFIATRHLKKRGTKRDPEELWNNHAAFLTAVLKEELARLLQRRPDLRDLPLDAVGVQPLTDPNGVFRVGNLRPIQFRRFRQKADDDGGRRTSGSFQITFPRPVKGPICLGHSSHFGMGLFVPDGSNNKSP